MGRRGWRFGVWGLGWRGAGEGWGLRLGVWALGERVDGGERKEEGGEGRGKG